MKITRLFLVALLTLSGCSMQAGWQVEEVDGKLVTTVVLEMDHPRVVADRMLAAIVPEDSE